MDSRSYLEGLKGIALNPVAGFARIGAPWWVYALGAAAIAAGWFLAGL